MVNKKIFGLLFLFVVVTSVVFFAGYLLLVNFPDFKIERVKVINQKGESVFNPEDFFRLDSTEVNLFSFDMKRAIQDILARHPELAGVSILKRFPNELLIVLKEREPVAAVVSGDFYSVDAEGFILPFVSIHRTLPKIIGVHSKDVKLYARSDSLKLKKALQLLAELKRAKVYPEYEISRIDVRRYSDVIFYLGDKIQVKMGEGDFKRKSELLSTLLAQLKASNTVPKYIDMRFDNPVVKP